MMPPVLRMHERAEREDREDDPWEVDDGDEADDCPDCGANFSEYHSLDCAYADEDEDDDA